MIHPARFFLFYLMILASSLVRSNAFAGGPLPSEAPRTVFVQLFEWPWQDVARECEIYLGPAGFSAVLVSPAQEHVSLPEHPWWERYQPVSYRLESRGGSAQEFADMVQRCNRAGVDVYADAVINHMSAFPQGTGWAGTPFKRFEYPGLFSFADFHHCGRYGDDGLRDYNDIYELQTCHLLGLADLNTGATSVQSKIAGYLDQLMSFGVRGFRIDAAKHIAASDIGGILRRVRQMPYVYQELIVGANDRLSRKSYLPNGDITIYSTPFAIGQAFKTGQLAKLPQMLDQEIDSQDAIVFIENHDLQRWQDTTNLVSYRKELAAYRLAQIFLLTWPYGYPHLFSGYDFINFDEGPPTDKNGDVIPVLNAKGECQSRWVCEHRLQEIPGLIRFRNETDSEFFVSTWWSNGSDQIAFGRGETGFVAINAGKSSMSVRLGTQLAPGRYCNLLDNCRTAYVIEKGGSVQIHLPSMSATVLLSESKFKNPKKFR